MKAIAKTTIKTSEGFRIFKGEEVIILHAISPCENVKLFEICSDNGSFKTTGDLTNKFFQIIK
jgi:hypothetical protein